MASALGQLSSAEQALAALVAGPSEAGIAESRSAVTQARIQLTTTTTLAEELMEALTESFDDFCDGYSDLSATDAVIRDTCAAVLPLTDVQVEALRGSFEDRSAAYEALGTTLIDSNVAFVAADADMESAISGLASAEEALSDLLQSITEDDLYQAEQAVEAAQASHTAALARLQDLRAAADDGDIQQAQASLESAQASLASAQAQYDELLAGPSENAIAQQEQEVRLAELSLEEAQAAVAELTVFAPFDGVVEAVSIQPGDRISAGSPAFTLNTSNRMLIALTVTEEDLLDLEIGQAGMASFDAIDGIQYPVRVSSVSRVPNAEQGVVTYDVEARILVGSEAEETADATGNRAGRGPGAGGEFGVGGGIGGPIGGLLSGIELPEGVTLQQVFQAFVRGNPLPEEVVVPEELEALISEQGAEALRRFAGAGQGPGAGRPPVEQPGTSVSRPLPAPGMNGNGSASQF